MNDNFGYEDSLGKEIVDCAYKVHSRLGPGLIEHVYEACLAYELRKKGIACERQVPVPIIYDELVFEEGFRIDIFVEQTVIIELKAVAQMHPIYEAQLLTYMKLKQKNLGYLINFNVPRIKDGIQRFRL